MRSLLFDRFCESMTMDHEKWHDGVGYDLALLDGATPEDRQSIENHLLTRGVRDWRDVEALHCLGSPAARKVVLAAYQAGDSGTRAMIMNYASDWFEESERTEAIVAALLDKSASDELTGVMLEVEEHHPPRVIDALLEGVRTRDGVVAGEFAMMLLFLHGLAESPWDMGPRPFILRFQDEARDPLYRELCQRIGVNPDRLFQSSKTIL